MLNGILVGVLALASLVVADPTAGCSQAMLAANACSLPAVENSGSQIDITANLTIPGNGGHNDFDRIGAGDTAPPAANDYSGCTVFSGDLRCGYTVVTVPDVTIDDLASFRPARPSLTGQPTGFGVVGAPTNVVAAASEQYLSGPLLGWDVTVRFVPAGFVFDYGDGSTARSTTGGSSWESLGQAQFTPTATSHVYRERGTYPVSVTVQYSASVDFGSGLWRPVPGYVTATTGGYDVRVVEARTALVDKTCLENPSGPGC